MANLSVTIAGVPFKNPLVVGSSSLTGNAESIETLVKAGAGGIITKTISPETRAGQGGFKAARYSTGWSCKPDPRVTMAQATAMLKRLRQSTDVPLIVNVIGRSDNENIWGEACQEVEAAGAHMIELDLNCHPEDGLVLDVPKNLSFYDDFSIGQEPAASARVTAAVKKACSIPVIAKMTLRAPDMIGVARACEAAGADALSGVNMINGVAGLDIENGGDTLFAGFDVLQGGPLLGAELSGLGRKYTALIGLATTIPYLSGSGVMRWEHAVERLMLGAAAVQVVSALYYEGPRALAVWRQRILAFLERHGHDDVAAIRGMGLKRMSARLAGTYTRQVPRVTDPVRWAEIGAEVYEKAAIACRCIRKEGSSVAFDEPACVGCALPSFHAPEAVKMLAAE